MRASYVYICECADGTWYTGWSTDPEHRVREHNAGRGAKYTRSRRPVRLIFRQAFASKEEALHWEYVIKHMKRREKEKLVRAGRLPEAETLRREAAARGGASLQTAKEPVRMGKLYYLMGKSAVGKDHIYEGLLRDERLRPLALRPLVIYTTRPMRDGEEDGVTYHFTDGAGMQRLEAGGKVIEKRCYDTTLGPWYYFTADDGNIDLTAHNYLAIGTPAAYKKIRKYFGPERVTALYIETPDGLRLERALQRERKQQVPQYEEMCRRFLADQKDFAPGRLKSAGIDRAFPNDGSLAECLDEIAGFLLEDGGFVPDMAGNRN